MTQLFNGKTVEELLYIFNEAIDDRPDVQTFPEAMREGILAVACALDPGWIEVSKTEPKHDHEYLCCVGSLVDVAFWNGRAKEWDVYNSSTASWDHYTFTHYREIQRLPEEDSL